MSEETKTEEGSARLRAMEAVESAFAALAKADQAIEESGAVADEGGVPPEVLARRAALRRIGESLRGLQEAGGHFMVGEPRRFPKFLGS